MSQKVKAASKSEIETFLKNHPYWKIIDVALSRHLTFADFKEAFAFMTAVAAEADAADHHPEWSNVYDKVSIRLITHDAGPAISQKDFSLAKKIDLLFVQKNKNPS
jgi:4a-hydroxytetrahydrobiopterin dehydratase